MQNFYLFKFRIVQNVINVCFASKSDDAIKRAKNKTSRCKEEQRNKNMCGDVVCENVHSFDLC